MIKADGLYCDWCQQRTFDILMLNKDVWARISDGNPDGFMCNACIVQKLGREPTPKDRSEPWWDY